MAARIAMMAITTRSSISVKARQLGITDEAAGVTTEPSGGRAILPLPRGGGEGRGERESAASRRILVVPLTLTLSPAEGERETIACICRASHGLLIISKYSVRCLGRFNEGRRGTAFITQNGVRILQASQSKLSKRFLDEAFHGSTNVWSPAFTRPEQRTAKETSAFLNRTS